MKQKRKKLKELPPIFSEISDRFAMDFLIAEQLHLHTMVKLNIVKFPISLLSKVFKKESPMIFNEIFSKVLDNDKKLSTLLMEAKIESFNIDKK